MSDLVAFLRARLDEDERVARAAADENREPSWRLISGEYVTGIGLTGMHTEGFVDEAPGEHIVRHDPARVLAEVDAKRQIIDEHRITPKDQGAGGAETFGCECCHFDYNEGYQGLGWCPTLRLLALPYADHPDYRDEWRP